MPKHLKVLPIQEERHSRRTVEDEHNLIRNRGNARGVEVRDGGKRRDADVTNEAYYYRQEHRWYRSRVNWGETRDVIGSSRLRR